MDDHTRLRVLLTSPVLPYARCVTQTIDAILEFIEANPAKSEEWKAKADAKLQTDGDGSTA